MYQKVIIAGNLGRDPEMRFLPNGAAVCNFSVATSERWKAADGEPMEHTEWWRCNAFERLAEVCGEYLKKGSKVLIEGTIRTRKWTDKDGVEKFTPELRVASMKMLGEKPDDGEGGDRGQSTRGASAPAGRPAPAGRSAPAQRPAARPPTNTGTGFDNMDDDIPF